MMSENLDKLDCYPLRNESTVPIGVNVERYNQHLLANSQRLFSNQSNQLEILQVDFKTRRKIGSFMRIK